MSDTLRLLREIRQQGEGTQKSVEELAKRMDRGFAGLSKRMDSVAQAIAGESVLGRYAAAEVEDRLAAVEKRLTVLEKRR